MGLANIPATQGAYRHVVASLSWSYQVLPTAQASRGEPVAFPHEGPLLTDAVTMTAQETDQHSHRSICPAAQATPIRMPVASTRKV